MRVSGVFWGGPNYSPPTPANLETFDSISMAELTFFNRIMGYDKKFPVVDPETAEMLIFMSTTLPRTMPELPTPDHRIVGHYKKSQRRWLTHREKV